MLYIILGVLIFLLLLSILLAYICYRMTFYSNRKKSNKTITLPDDEIFTTYKDTILKDIEDINNMPCEHVSIKSHDGLTLKGRYFEYKKGAPIEVMFHGYKGDSTRDMSSGVKRAFACGRNALIVDHRSSGKSEGHVITFGIKERFDCVDWVNFVINKFGSDVKIIIAGISMGAATVLMASSMNLPKNVVGVVADCGYNNASDIIKKVISGMKLPTKFVYPFIKLGARLFGKFNLEEYSPYESVQKTNIPIIFFHGANDNFVPHDMSVKLFNACSSKKKLVTIENANHGVSYLVDPKKYIDELEEFFDYINDLTM